MHAGGSSWCVVHRPREAVTISLRLRIELGGSIEGGRGLWIWDEIHLGGSAVLGGVLFFLFFVEQKVLIGNRKQIHTVC